MKKTSKTFLNAAGNPLLIYDGDCAFCRVWIEKWRRKTGDRVRYEPFQEAAKLFPQIPLQDFQKSVKLILADGRVFSGAEAVFRSLSYAPESKGRLLWFYENMPGFKEVSEWLYNRIAANRSFLYKLTIMLR